MREWPPKQAPIKASIDALHLCIGRNLVDSERSSVFLAETLSAANRAVTELPTRCLAWLSQLQLPSLKAIKDLLVLVSAATQLWNLKFSFGMFVFVLFYFLSLSVVQFEVVEAPLPVYVFCMLVLLDLRALLALLVYNFRALFAFIKCAARMSVWCLWYVPLFALLALLLYGTTLWLRSEFIGISSRLTLASHGNPHVRCRAVAVRKWLLWNSSLSKNLVVSWFYVCL